MCSHDYTCFSSVVQDYRTAVEKAAALGYCMTLDWSHPQGLVCGSIRWLATVCSSLLSPVLPIVVNDELMKYLLTK